MESPVIGIDLGTSYSSVVLSRKGRLRFKATIPSVVAFTDTENYLIGQAAVDYAETADHSNVIYNVKQLIGRHFNDAFVQREIKLLPFDLFSGSDGRLMISIKHKGSIKHYSMEQISSFVLMALVSMAESYAGCTINNVVIAVPAYFNSFQRRATMEAGKLAGLNVLQLINDTSAVGIAWCLDTIASNLLIFDLGASYFDVSVLTINNGSVEVKATVGDPYLGGEDFTQRIMKHILEEFKREHQKELNCTPEALRRLRTACDKAKRILSSKDEAVIEICPSTSASYSLSISIDRFEELTADLCRKCMDLVEKCLRDAQMDKISVNFVVAIGGSSKIPRIERLLYSLFNREMPLTVLGLDEAVAYGASVQTAILGGRIDQRVYGIHLSDRTATSFGIGISASIMDVVIPRNTAFPTKMTRAVLMKYDCCPWTKIWIYEGERLHVKNCKLLGVDFFCGAPTVHVCFEVDVNGILKVSAEENSLDYPKIIKITNNEDELYRKFDWLMDLEHTMPLPYQTKIGKETSEFMLEKIFFTIYASELAKVDKEKILNKIRELRNLIKPAPEAEADYYCHNWNEILEMLLKADSNHVECEDRRAQAKYSLETLCLTLRRIRNADHPCKLSAADDKKLEVVFRDTLCWLEKNSLAEAWEYDEKRKKLENLFNYLFEGEKMAEPQKTLEKYCLSLRKTIDEGTVARLSSAGKKRLEDVIECIFQWMENNQLAEDWEYDEKLMELENLHKSWLSHTSILGFLMACLKGCLRLTFHLTSGFNSYHPKISS